MTRAANKGQGRFVRPCLFLGLALFASACMSAGATGDAAAGDAAASGGRTGRIMPPAANSCDPNQLTSYFGVVSGYKRGATSTWLKIDTDFDTVEEVTIPHAGARTAQARFLLRGQPFEAKDWAIIESKPGVLRKGTRATAWVCGDGTTPALIDWNGAAE